MAKQSDISVSQTLHASDASMVADDPGVSDGGHGPNGGGGAPSRRLTRLLAALAVLALTTGAVVWLVRIDRGQTTARVTAEAQAAALRAADGVKSLIASVEGQTQNATANPRLVAALNADVDQETLRDLLLTEPWWEPFRRAIDGFGLYADDNTPVVSSRLPTNFNVYAMVQDARQGRRASSGLQLAAGQVLAVAACPVDLAGRSEWPVLVSTKVLDVGLLSEMAERAGGAVAISDGRRLLVAATTGTTGSGDDLLALKRGIDIPVPGRVSFGTATVAALPLSGGLRLLVSVAAPVGPGGMPIPWSAVAILIVGVTLSVGLYLMLARQAGDEELLEDDDLPGRHRQAGESLLEITGIPVGGVRNVLGRQPVEQLREPIAVPVPVGGQPQRDQSHPGFRSLVPRHLLPAGHEPDERLLDDVLGLGT